VIDASVEAAAADPASGHWLVAGRLALREFRTGDVDDIVAMHRDSRVRAALVDDHPLDDPAVAGLLVERLQVLYRARPGHGIWHASVPAPAETGHGEADTMGNVSPARRFIGWFNLMPMTDHPGQVEIGSRLRPEAWGSQLAFEGCDALLRHAFDDPCRTQVWAVAHPVNRPALAVLSALGFMGRGLQRYEGRTGLHCVITRERWQAAAALPRRQRWRAGLAVLAAMSAGDDVVATDTEGTASPTREAVA